MRRVLVSLLAGSACALALVVAATVAGAANLPSASPPGAPAATSLHPQGVNADYAVVDVGSQAPDFTFESVTGWLRLRDLRAQGNVLLVIAPDEPTLAALQRERAVLGQLGVVPVAVLDRRAGACRDLAGKLGLDFPVLPDPRRVIGEQFNALDPDSRADAPAWFVLDHQGRVRDLGRHDWPRQAWTELSAHALGLEVPGGTAPAAHHAR